MNIRSVFSLSNVFLASTVLVFSAFLAVLLIDGGQLAQLAPQSSSALAGATLYDLQWLDKNGKIVDEIDAGSNYDEVLNNFGVEETATEESIQEASTLCCYSQNTCTSLLQNGAVEQGVLACIQKHGLVVQCSDSACVAPDTTVVEEEPEQAPEEEEQQVQPEEQPAEEEVTEEESSEISQQEEALPEESEEEVVEEEAVDEEGVSEEEIADEVVEEQAADEQVVPVEPEVTDVPWWQFFFPWLF